MTKQPTQEELKKFWAWCGVKFKHVKGEGWCWYNASKHDWYYDSPELTLDNLFAYAVQPLVDYFIKHTKTEEEYRKAYYNFMCKWIKDYVWNEPHIPEQSFFWAILEVIND